MNYVRKRQMSLGVIFSYVLIIVKLAAGILYTPIVLRTLGQSQYGVYSLSVSFMGYLTILNAGINAAYIRFYVQEKTVNEQNVIRLNGVFCKIFIGLSLISLAGGLLLAQFSPYLFGSKITADEYELVRKCFQLLAVTIGIEMYTCLFKSFITANEEFIFGKTVDIVISILTPVLTLPFLLNDYDCASIIFIRLLMAVLTLILDVIFCRKKLRIAFQFGKVDPKLLSNIGQFIGFIVLQSVMDQLNWQVDKFILAWTQGTSEISIYSVGGTFNTYFLQIAGAVSGVFIAEINRLVALDDEKELNNLFRRSSKIFMYIIGMIIVGFFVIGRSFVLRWAGADYGRSFIVGWLLMTPVTFSLIMGLGQDIARAKNRHQIQILINIGVCILNAIMSIPLAMHWGAIGSAVGTFVAEIVVCIIVQPIYYKKVLNLEVGGVFKDIFRYLPGLILPVMFGIAINHFGLLKNSYGSIVLYSGLYVLIYFISVWMVSMGKQDRIYMKDFMRKRIHR